MGGLVWKRKNVVGPRAVNGLNVAGYGRSGSEKSCTVASLSGSLIPVLPLLIFYHDIRCDVLR